MGKLFYHEKTPVDLNSCLLADSHFADNWKIIPSVVKVLNQILRFNLRDEDKGGTSDITWRFFHGRFGGGYTLIIQKLEDLGLLHVERAGRGEKGLKCYGYRLTEKCVALLSEENREYLQKILTDKTAKRRLQKNISERKYRKKVYGDVRDCIKATIDGITFNEEEVNSLSANYTPEKAAHVRSVLIEIVEKNYDDLHHNEKDNRVPNPYTQLPAEVKTLIEVNGLRYVTTYDIRSAYPSLWAHWIQSLNHENQWIQAEKLRYEEIFLNPAPDYPKKCLSEELGIPISEIKSVMIQYFNGKGFRNNVFVLRNRKNPFVKFNAWIKSNFPMLYALWKQTDIKQTGNAIGRNFETKLMLDESIFQKARSLGLAIGYENDGFSIYGNVGKEHPSVRQLLDFVGEQSQRLLGIKLVIVSKPTPKWNPFDILRESYEAKADDVDRNWKKYNQRFFKLHPDHRDRDEFFARREEYRKGLETCKKVLERLEQEPGAA